MKIINLDTKEEIPFETFKFSTGEPNVRINMSRKQMRVRVQCGLEDLIEALMAIEILEREYGIIYIELYLPYLPFSRQDRRCNPGESFGAAVLAFILRAFSIYRVVTYDVHNSEVGHMYPRFINEMPKIPYKLIDSGDYDVICFPDKGAEERYLFLDRRKKILIGEKVRDPQTGEITNYQLTGDIPAAPSKILVIDDICDGGRTFIELAKLLPDQHLELYVSHGIFSKGFDELKQCYKHIHTTDSIYKGESDEFITVHRCL